ncbi:MAG: branched-chain-amino-acid transaminase [Nitrospirae bacterium GWC2_57_13]|jgi:branched-chain amino acid aminotransferase|nr:MAG: branched-chain-amino-acid transaminase [Nitrospirae bacterium GWC2_57_13]OGW46832.1 MAG: branched-chain-amino-acid transaminase [Nitrospirae bacterium GWD2_57_8]
MLVYLNGEFVPKQNAMVSVFDHGFLYGDGIYETLRAYGGSLFLAEKHLFRLQHSADAISLKLPLPLDRIGGALTETVRVNGLRDAYVRIQISRGPGEIGLDPALCPAPTMVITAKQFTDYPQNYYEQGVSVAVVETRRNHPLALPPSIKGTNFLNNILAKIEAIEAGAYEGIMLNWEGFVAEGTISNIFSVRDSELYTPGLEVGILEGVTRGLILELAARAGIAVRERAFPPEELSMADECFITNTTMEVMPVTRIDGRPVGTGRPGPMTARLLAAYRNEVARCLKT